MTMLLSAIHPNRFELADALREIQPGLPRRVWPTQSSASACHRVRLAARRCFHANVRAIPLDGRQAPAGGITYDLSHRGTFISSTSAPPAGSLLLLRIYTLRRRRISVVARVVHSRSDVGYGCEFLDIDDAKRAALMMLATRRC